MKTPGVLLCLIVVVIFGICAWQSFSHHAWLLGALCVVGMIVTLLGMLKSIGAWRDPKPWNGDGE
jgi:hypothetical protein